MCVGSRLACVWAAGLRVWGQQNCMYGQQACVCGQQTRRQRFHDNQSRERGAFVLFLATTCGCHFGSADYLKTAYLVRLNKCPCEHTAILVVYIPCIACLYVERNGWPGASPDHWDFTISALEIVSVVFDCT